MDKNQFDTPILFLIFNRPNLTKQVFERIRELQPAYLYIGADGPRKGKPSDIENCRQAREITNQINWDCELKTLFRENNLGCKMAVSSAISWFFENVEEGIILEDDCLPEISFFHFCQKLLEYYRNDDRIMHICGSNYQDGIQRGDVGYYFSIYNHIWGWATWRRAWKSYDVEIKNYPDFINHDVLSNFFNKKQDKKFWINIFKKVYNGEIDTWDYQWTYAIWKNHGLSIIPNKNLVVNIGLGDDATHTKTKVISSQNLDKIDAENIVHPIELIRDIEADDYTFQRNFRKPFFKRMINFIINKIS
jgi:hypothetical protein